MIIQTQFPHVIHRKGLSLVEVLATIFILAIGMVSVLVLFPVGALKVRQALVNERIALSASSAESTFKILMGSNSQGVSWPATGGNSPLYTQLADGSGIAVIDPLAPDNPFAGSILTQTFVYKTGVSVAAAGPTPNYRRWFTLTDDIEWGTNGSPDGTVIARGSSFSFALMVRKTTLNSKDFYELTTLAYHGRNLNLPNQIDDVALSLDTNQAAGSDFNFAGTNAVELLSRPSTPDEGRTLDKGAWIMDVTNSGVDNFNRPRLQLEFYQVQNITDLGSGRIRLELDRPIMDRFGNGNYKMTEAKWVDRLVGVFYKGEINLP